MMLVCICEDGLCEEEECPVCIDLADTDPCPSDDEDELG